MQKTKRSMIQFTLGLLIVAGALGFVAGCGDLPTSPTVQNDDAGTIVNPKQGDNGVAASGLLGNVLRDVVGVVRNVVEVVGALGGQICTSLGNGRKCGLDVPAGALDQPTAISMRVEDFEGRLSSAIFDFGPDGLVFEKSTTLFYDVKDPNGTIKTLTWFDPVANQWVVQAQAKVKNGRVTFSVNHFSKYGIS